jgi:hypothetical protein
MRRAFAGLRAARIRPDKGVRITVAAAGIVLLAACAPADGTGTGSAQIAMPSIDEAPTTTAAPTTEPTTTAPTTTAPTTVAPTTVAPTTVAPIPPATVVVPKPSAVPKPIAPPRPRPKPVPKPEPKPTAAPAPSCDPNYSGQCLKSGIGDYDCSSGSGNGPNYVYGTVRVVGSDPFDLDRDDDGIGCEKG